ncbi:hypothetical protein ACFT9I_08635 [Streptomyces sp. NPDC057137]|uniref:hypothetical protein n=1 Tax=Streptomyces sp. NPDC057137 TaxID=3346030 RepID=UPI003642651B
MNDGVVWLVLSTSGLLVLLNAGIGVLALWSHRSDLRVTERLIASGELDVYHATWLTGCGYSRTWTSTWHRERVAAELALRALNAAGLVHTGGQAGLVPPPGGQAGLVPPPGAPHPADAAPPDHPLTLAAWRFVRDSWSAGRPVTVRALADHPAFKTACTAHRERLSGRLPPRRTRRDNHAERAPWTVALIGAGWISLNTTVLMATDSFGDTSAGPEGFERAVALLALAVGAAALPALVLVVLHVFLWRAWQDRWPRRLRTHCEELIRRESRDWVPLSRIPVG